MSFPVCVCGVGGEWRFWSILGGDCVLQGALWVLGWRCPCRVVVSLDLCGPVVFRDLGLVLVTMLA